MGNGAFLNSSEAESSPKPSSPTWAGRREIFGWAMFDLANQAYTTLIITVVFGVVFTRVIVGDGPDYRLGNLLWSVSLAASYALVVTIGPVCGAIMDYAAVKKRFLFASYLLTVFTTACLYFVAPGQIALAMTLIIISNFGYALGEAFIAGFLPSLGPPEKLGRISGFGWALGYVGGLVATGIVLLGLGGIAADNFANLRLVGPLAALFFLLGAIPTFIWVREPEIRSNHRDIRSALPKQAFLRIGFQRVTWTLRRLDRFRDLGLFLASLFFAMAGLSIIISFAFIYGDQIIRWEPLYQMLMFVLTQVTAACGALVFGLLQDQIGAKRTYNLTLLLWIAAVTMIAVTPQLTGVLNRNLGLSLESQQVFLGAGCLAGLGLGSLQSSARALVGRLTPQSKAAEFFGFWGMTVKLAAIFGILGLGVLQVRFGLQLSVLLCLVFFVTALAIAQLVDQNRGEAATLEKIGKDGP
ncbi:MAG: MFS transporter [Desulfovibrionales bacterium]|nr:MAG: MFS transporter [Desulfovibrionales bacterium]